MPNLWEKRRKLMTIREVARYLSLSEKTVYRLIQAGKLPAAKIGGQWRFDQKMLDDWVAEQADGNRLTRLGKEVAASERGPGNT